MKKNEFGLAVLFLFVFYAVTIAGVNGAMESNRITNSENSGVIEFGFGER